MRVIHVAECDLADLYAYVVGRQLQQCWDKGGNVAGDGVRTYFVGIRLYGSSTKIPFQ